MSASSWGAVLGALLLPAVSLWGNSMMVSSPTCGVERFITPAMLERFGGPSLALVVECGMCWLYPVVCFLCYLPMVFILFNSSALFHCFMVSVPALAGLYDKKCQKVEIEPWFAPNVAK